jgi:hypothetical protein
MSRTRRLARTVRPLSAVGADTDRRESSLSPTNTRLPTGPARRGPATPQPAGRAGAAPGPPAAAGPGSIAARCRAGSGPTGVAGHGREPARLHRGVRRRRLGAAASFPHRGWLHRAAGRSAVRPPLPGAGVLGAAGHPFGAAVPGRGEVAQEADGRRRPAPIAPATLLSLSTAQGTSSTPSPQASNRPGVNILGSTTEAHRICCGQSLTGSARPSRVEDVESRPWGRSWRACSGASSSLPRPVRLAPRGAKS